MSTYILTSMFPDGFNEEITKLFQEKILKRNKFAFVVSEFEGAHEENDNYFQLFLNMFEEKGIHFEKAYVVDGRMTKEEARNAVAEADVVWLSGGDTPTQFRYLEEYGLDTVIRQHNGNIEQVSSCARENNIAFK